MAVRAHYCRYGCGRICPLTPRCCLTFLVNREKIIFLVFDVSAVSKEEPGLNKLEEPGGPSGSPSYICLRERAET